jgi:hypothetical protein
MSEVTRGQKTGNSGKKVPDGGLNIPVGALRLINGHLQFSHFLLLNFSELIWKNWKNKKRMRCFIITKTLLLKKNLKKKMSSKILIFSKIYKKLTYFKVL